MEPLDTPEPATTEPAWPAWAIRLAERLARRIGPLDRPPPGPDEAPLVVHESVRVGYLRFDRVADVVKKINREAFAGIPAGCVLLENWQSHGEDEASLVVVYRSVPWSRWRRPGSDVWEDVLDAHGNPLYESFDVAEIPDASTVSGPPKGRRVLVSSDGQQTRVVDLETGREFYCRSVRFEHLPERPPRLVLETVLDRVEITADAEVRPAREGPPEDGGSDAGPPDPPRGPAPLRAAWKADPPPAPGE